jgi:hypothetical protein
MSDNKEETPAQIAVNAIKIGFASWLIALMYQNIYKGDGEMFSIHGIFISLHVFLFGVKRFTLGNFNGWDLIFGCVYLYFCFQNPVGFLLSYFAWAFFIGWVFKLKPVFDETSA